MADSPERPNYGAFDNFMRASGRNIRRGWVWLWAKPWKVKGPAYAVALLVILAIIGAAGSGDKANNNKAEAAAATESLAATKTPADTPTPKPTNTPKPTETPKPTATPTVDNSETVYRTTWVAGTQKMQTDLATFQSLAGAPSFTSAKWRSDMIAVCDSITNTAKILRDLRAPSSKWDAFDATQRKAMDAYIEAMTLIKSGVNNLNAGAINDANAKMSEALQLLTSAVDLIPKQ